MSIEAVVICIEGEMVEIEKPAGEKKIVIENNWIERENIKNKCKHPSCCSLYSSPLNVTSLNDGSISDQQCGVAYERASEGGRDIY